LLASVVVVRAPLPGESDPHTAYRKKVLDLCLSDSPRDQRRRCILEHNLCGNWADKRIEYYTSRQQPNKKAWARQCSWALLPSRIVEFQRNRWLNNTACVLDTSLLAACHGIFSEATPLWLKEMGAKRPPNRVAAPHQGAWAIADDSSSDSGGDIEMDRARCPADGDWAAYNSKQRGDTWRFSQSEPLGKLLVVAITLGPQASLMRKFLQRAGGAWRREQVAQAIKTGAPLTSPLLDVLSGRLTRVFLDKATALLRQPDLWEAIPADLRTHQQLSLAFAMLSTAICAVHHRLHHPSKQYPLKLFTVLSAAGRTRVAAALRATPVCLMDEFTQRFLKRHGLDLETPDTLAALAQLAHALWVDISEQECHHATIRRMIVTRHTWGAAFPDLSSNWCMNRLQRLAAPPEYHNAPPPPPREEPEVPKKRKRGYDRFQAFANTRLPELLRSSGARTAVERGVQMKQLGKEAHIRLWGQAFHFTQYHFPKIHVGTSRRVV
jgi:hypothetical protein